MTTDPADAVYQFVRTVPPGKVVTYGQVTLVHNQRLIVVTCD